MSTFAFSAWGRCEEARRSPFTHHLGCRIQQQGVIDQATDCITSALTVHRRTYKNDFESTWLRSRSATDFKTGVAFDVLVSKWTHIEALVQYRRWGKRWTSFKQLKDNGDHQIRMVSNGMNHFVSSCQTSIYNPYGAKTA